MLVIYTTLYARVLFVVGVNYALYCSSECGGSKLRSVAEYVSQIIKGDQMRFFLEKNIYLVSS